MLAVEAAEGRVRIKRLLLHLVDRVEQRGPCVDGTQPEPGITEAVDNLALADPGEWIERDIDAAHGGTSGETRGTKRRCYEDCGEDVGFADETTGTNGE